MALATVQIPSQLFGTYSLQAKIGEGGMAEVYRAEVVGGDRQSRSLAVKIMKPGAPTDLFAAEADLMGLVSHPNLVERVEVGHAGDRPYIAMEYVFGGDLAQVLRACGRERRPLPANLAIEIVVRVLCGLAYFHQVKSRQGAPLELVHGDVNPSNVFLSLDGKVKLGDFGVASVGALGGSLPPGVTAGKLHYLSPEQVSGETLTPASDLFSAGVVLYEVVAGERPFEGPESPAVFEKIREAKFVPPSAIETDLVRILRRSLERQAKNRYRSAGEFAGDLVRFQLDHGQQASPQAIGAFLEDLLEIVA